MDLKDLERDTSRYLDDLDVALYLLAMVPELYGRLDDQRRATLLQILAKRIIVSADGEIISHELHSPFLYLLFLQQGIESANKDSIQLASKPLGEISANSPREDVGRFLSQLRFEQKDRLVELQTDIMTP